jgi:hypothetical protein
MMRCRAVATTNLKITPLEIANAFSSKSLRRGHHPSLIDTHLRLYCCCRFAAAWPTGLNSPARRPRPPLVRSNGDNI